jgi:hypothetical protein
VSPFVAGQKEVTFVLMPPEMHARRSPGVALVVLLGAVASVVALATLAGCGGGKSEAHSLVAVAGSMKCKNPYGEVYRCVTSMSDARVSGTEVVKLQVAPYGADASATALSGPATLSNDQGTWRGTSRGATVLNDPSGVYVNYQRQEYRGEGAFKGLRYVELVAGTDQELEVTGWIEPAQ